MKKILALLIVFFLSLIPFSIKADYINDYYVDLKLSDNGDLHVREIFTLDGTFNGFERIINFKNPYAKFFDGSLDSFNGSHIYNGDGIVIKKVSALNVPNRIDFSYLDKNFESFEKVLYAEVGDSNKYTLNSTSNGEVIRVYNPSKNNKRAFYVEYYIKNVGVLHNDIGEIAWNIFSNELNENIRNFELRAFIPNNKKEIRVWGHGPLTGEVDIVDKEHVVMKIENLRRNTAMDIRIVFDKEVIVNSTKKTEITALDKILSVETKKANELREEARKKIEEEARIATILDIVRLIYLGSLFLLIRYIYIKYDKERSSSFKTKYFRDFPAEYGPNVVGYLFSRKIDTKEMSSTILNLITKRVITYEQEGKRKYKFKYNETNQILTESEQKLIGMLFNEIGTKDSVTITEINSFAKRKYQKFLDLYNDWKKSATAEAVNENFYEDSSAVKGLAVIYGIIGFIFFITTLEYSNFFVVTILGAIIIFISSIYFITFTKRTEKGNEHFLKWQGLKNFLDDFGNFKDRDLPHINLWEKYLVYAVVFGNAKRLAKTMEIKFKEMPNTAYENTVFRDIYYFRMFTDLNNSVTSGITSAVSQAVSTKAISESRNSSGGGFGGGFSGGGGSFGGGGGGGRF